MVAFWVEKRRRQATADLDGDIDKILERVRREVREDLRLDYLVTGSWSLKGITSDLFPFEESTKRGNAHSD